MRSRNIIRIALLAIIFTGMFFVLQSSASSNKDNASKESLETCQKQKGDSKMIWENLSHQFFSSF